MWTLNIAIHLINHVAIMSISALILSYKRRPVAWIGLALLVIILYRQLGMESSKLKFMIKTSWDSEPVNHRAVELNIYNAEHGLGIEIDAPFFNDPPKPNGPPGLPFQGLWEYEVVEAFFLNGQNQYLEVEFCPHGQHLALLLNGYRKPFKDMLNMTYSAVISGNSWKGTAVIPWEYLPQNVEKFNAYAIHGSGKDRVYESLFPVPHGEFKDPDFHRLDYFQIIDFDTVIPKPVRTGHPSAIWKDLST